MNPDDRPRKTSTPVLVKLAHASAPFLSTFLLIHLSAPVLANVGGSNLSSNLMVRVSSSPPQKKKKQCSYDTLNHERISISISMSMSMSMSIISAALRKGVLPNIIRRKVPASDAVRDTRRVRCRPETSRTRLHRLHRLCHRRQPTPQTHKHAKPRSVRLPRLPTHPRPYTPTRPDRRVPAHLGRRTGRVGLRVRQDGTESLSVA